MSLFPYAETLSLITHIYIYIYMVDRLFSMHVTAVFRKETLKPAFKKKLSSLSETLIFAKSIPKGLTGKNICCQWHV
jgi:hypothetical protein